LLWGVTQVVLIPYVVHFILLATAILYAACHWSSLALREDIPKEGEEGYDPNAVRETLKQEDAYQFPLFGSLSLLSLYLAFKFFGQYFVNLLIIGYFGLVGCGGLTITLMTFLTQFAPKSLSERELGWKKIMSSSILDNPLDLGLKFRSYFCTVPSSRLCLEATVFLLTNRIAGGRIRKRARGIRRGRRWRQFGGLK
jgi:hypothetical protein